MYNNLHFMSLKLQNSTIHVSLTPTLTEFIDNLVQSGLYGNTSEVIREALREKYQTQILQNSKLKKLQQAVQIGLDQAENNQFSSDNLESILKKIEK